MLSYTVAVNSITNSLLSVSHLTNSYFICLSRFEQGKPPMSVKPELVNCFTNGLGHRLYLDRCGISNSSWGGKSKHKANQQEKIS